LCTQVAKNIYDQFIMKELLSSSHTYTKRALESVQAHLAKYYCLLTIASTKGKSLFSKAKKSKLWKISDCLY
jgi:hypothetical protein